MVALCKNTIPGALGMLRTPGIVLLPGLIPGAK